MSRRDFYEEEKLKRTVYIFGIVLVLSVVIFLTIFVMYNKKLKEESSENLLSLGSMNDIVANDELEETSKKVTDSNYSKCSGDKTKDLQVVSCSWEGTSLVLLMVMRASAPSPERVMRRAFISSNSAKKVATRSDFVSAPSNNESYFISFLWRKLRNTYTIFEETDTIFRATMP